MPFEEWGSDFPQVTPTRFRGLVASLRKHPLSFTHWTAFSITIKLLYVLNALLIIIDYILLSSN